MERAEWRTGQFAWRPGMRDTRTVTVDLAISAREERTRGEGEKKKGVREKGFTAFINAPGVI